MSLTLTLLVGSAALIAWIIYNFNHRNSTYWSKLGIEFVECPSFLLRLITGNLGFHINDAPIYQQLKAKAQRFGGIMELWNSVLFLTDLDLMKNVYIKDFDSFSKRRGFNVERDDPHLHLTLFNHKGQAWKTLRQIMSPTFTTGKIRRMWGIFNGSGKNMCVALKQRLEESESSSVEMREYLKKATMDIIASSAFGVQTDIFDGKSESAFYSMGQKIQETFIGLNVVKFAVSSLLPNFSKLFTIKMIDREADNFFSKVILNVLEHRRRTGEKREDFIQIMMEAQAENDKINQTRLAETKDALVNEDGEPDSPVINITDDLIISNSIIFILGGFDTTEATLDFAMYELALNPDIQDKLVSELEDARDDTEDFTYDSINNLEYLDMIVSETMRKYPVATRNERKSSAPYKIPGTDVVIPKHTIVAIPVYQIHHDPDIWPEPSVFDPLRFTKDKVTARHVAAFQAFGLGPMNCIGNRFALMEIKAIVAQLVLNFKFEPSEKTEIPISLVKAGPLRPRNDMWLKVTPRR